MVKKELTKAEIKLKEYKKKLYEQFLYDQYEYKLRFPVFLRMFVFLDYDSWLSGYTAGMIALNKELNDTRKKYE